MRLSRSMYENIGVVQVQGSVQFLKMALNSAVNKKSRNASTEYTKNQKNSHTYIHTTYLCLNN